MASFRSFRHATRVVALSLRFIRLCRRQTDFTSKDLYRLVEKKFIQWSQRQHFREEIASVRAGEKTLDTSKLAAVTLLSYDEKKSYRSS